MEKLDWDWSTATPELYDEVDRVALHVLNVHFIGEENRNRVIKFAIARVLHFDRHLPKGSSQRIRFDLRGQQVSNKNLEPARQTILHEAAKYDVHVSVDFLTN